MCMYIAIVLKFKYIQSTRESTGEGQLLTFSVPQFAQCTHTWDIEDPASEKQSKGEVLNYALIEMF